MDQLKNLPNWIKAVLVTLGAGCIIGTVNMIDPHAIVIVAIGLLAVVIIFLLYLLVIHLLKKRRAASMGGGLSMHSGLTPRGISDPAQRAKLDNMRQTFQKGVEKFRAAGKDLYSLPWYMVVGEPGAGKSEAIRHCNVGFPPGLQDELQGSGGTINMHWWFTNQAVILDTAGRLMFEEVAPGTTSEWREFLTLLRKSRPNCPINGLILVIPADSLIKDNADAIARKASRIAEQLNTIQAALDVRFPVFVLITKTDLINGFREFFENVKNPHLQHQMVGWSNPDALDQPFRPELVDKYLKQVVNSISRRRLGLLQDPTPQSDLTGGRRLDEVDAVFALPASLDLLAPRLRRYLEMVFVPNEWSGKPLFLRGIYFTSAMREGSALDLELAEAIGVPVDSLPEGKSWERDRAYFLRDLFLEKIFREKGLVTRATNTKRMMRRRQIILFGFGFAALVTIFAFSWVGAKALRESVGRERSYWVTASQGWVDGAWHPIVSPEFKGSANYIFNGKQEITAGNETMTLAEFHRRLAELAKTDVRVPWVFKPMNSLLAGANANRKRAERIVFEASVIKPMVQSTREKIDLVRDDWTPRSSDALAYLIHLEGMIYYRSAGLTSDELSAEGFFGPLGNFLYNDPKADPGLKDAFDWNYTGGGDGRGYWPPRWLSGGTTLAENRPIAVGLGAFVRAIINSQKTQEAGFDQIKAMTAQVEALKPAEAALVAVAADPDASPAAITGALDTYLKAKNAVDQMQAKVAQTGLFPAGPISLFGSYQLLVEEATKRSQSAMQQLQSELTRFDTSLQDKSRAPYPLPTEIARRLTELQQQLRANATADFPPEQLDELKALDHLFLEKAADGQAIYAVRADVYQRISALMNDSNGTDPLIGAFAGKVDRLRNQITSLQDRAARYQGGYAAEFAATARRVLAVAQARRIDGIYAQYFSEFDRSVLGQGGYPLLRGGGRTINFDTLRMIRGLLRSVHSDLPALRTTPPEPMAATVDRLDARDQALSAVADALLTDEDQPANVTITLIKYDDQRTGIMQELNTDAFAGRFVGTLWRTLRINGRRVRVEAPADDDLVHMGVSDPSFQIDFFKRVDDDTADRSFSYKADWAPLQLLQLPTAHRLPGGKDWQVMISLKDDLGQERYLLLRLHFDKSLPELDQWPTTAQRAL